MGYRAMGLLVAALLVLGVCGGLWAQDKPKPVSATPPEKLGAFLKEIKGWKAEGPAETQSMKTPQGSYTIAFRSYSQGEKGLELTLIDGANIPQAYEDYEELKGEVDSSEPNAPKKVQVAGYPALEVFEADSETSTLMIMVKDRLLVILDMDGAGPKDDLKPLASQLDLKGIEALVGPSK
jgi:hypothetical protein